MKRRSNFAAMRLSDLCESLMTAYGNDKGGKIFAAAENILYTELAGVDDRGNK